MGVRVGREVAAAALPGFRTTASGMPRASLWGEWILGSAGLVVGAGIRLWFAGTAESGQQEWGAFPTLGRDVSESLDVRTRKNLRPSSLLVSNSNDKKTASERAVIYPRSYGWAVKGVF